MSFFSNALKKLTGLRDGFTPERLVFGDLTVTTTALLAEGGYSYVYSAKETSGRGRTFAAKKVLAQDAETRHVAEVEIEVLERVAGHDGFVQCFGSMSRVVGRGKHEYWMLLDFCTNGSLIDLLYNIKGKAGAFEKREILPEARILEITEGLVAAVAHMHSLSPPITHRDLKLENVLGTAEGRYVLCDFGSAVTTALPAERTRKAVLEEEERIHKYSTLMYRAPEMVDLYRNQEVGLKTDVWALGCILFALCFRDHPFAEESSLQILNAGYTIPADSPHSARMHKLIRALLEPNPAIRPAAADVLVAIRKLRRALETGGSPMPAAAGTATSPTAVAPSLIAATAAAPPSPPPSVTSAAQRPGTSDQGPGTRDQGPVTSAAQWSADFSAASFGATESFGDDASFGDFSGGHSSAVGDSGGATAGSAPSGPVRASVRARRPDEAESSRAEELGVGGAASEVDEAREDEFGEFSCGEDSDRVSGRTESFGEWEAAPGSEEPAKRQGAEASSDSAALVASSLPRCDMGGDAVGSGLGSAVGDELGKQEGEDEFGAFEASPMMVSGGQSAEADALSDAPDAPDVQPPLFAQPLD